MQGLWQNNIIYAPSPDLQVQTEYTWHTAENRTWLNVSTENYNHYNTGNKFKAAVSYPLAYWAVVYKGQEHIAWMMEPTSQTQQFSIAIRLYYQPTPDRIKHVVAEKQFIITVHVEYLKAFTYNKFFSADANHGKIENFYGESRNSYHNPNWNSTDTKDVANGLKQSVFFRDKMHRVNFAPNRSKGDVMYNAPDLEVEGWDYSVCNAPAHWRIKPFRFDSQPLPEEQ